MRSASSAPRRLRQGHQVMGRSSRTECACSSSSSTGICSRTRPRTDRRLAPGHELRAWSGLAAGRVHELRVFPRQARRSRQRLRPGLHLSSDLRSPVGAVGRDLERDPCALHSTNLAAFGEQRSDLGRESPGAAPENKRKRLRLALVGALVDEETGRPLDLPRPEITFPSAHPDEAETIEVDVAVVALLDVPEQNRLTETVVRGLRERAGARDGAAAVVEPVSHDVPGGNSRHEDLRSCESTRLG